MISEKHKFVFLRVPKAAGRSIDLAINKYYVNKPRGLFVPLANRKLWDVKYAEISQHCAYFHLKNTRLGIPNVDNYYKFAFVRDPWDRMVSYFFGRSQKQPVLQKSDKHKKYFNNWLKKEDEKNFYLGKYYYHHQEDYAGYRFGHYPMVHMQQIQYATDDMSPFGKIKLDFIGRFENLKKDVKKVSNDIGVKINLGAKKVGKIKRKHYSFYYTEKSKEIVSRRFNEDIEYFDYSYEDRT